MNEWWARRKSRLCRPYDHPDAHASRQGKRMSSLCLPSANKGMLKFRSAQLIKRLALAMFCKSVIATRAGDQRCEEEVVDRS
jgi:hypothetical protein